VKTSDDGLSLIKRFEGVKLTAYKCPAGKNTIGYGHTGDDVKPGMKITEAEAHELLRQDTEKAAAAVRHLVTVPLEQCQFDALVSFVFNVGTGAFKSSTMLRKLNERFNLGAADEFLRWIYVKGSPSGGLINRRSAERDLFLRDLA
jgi:lysozyme